MAKDKVINEIKRVLELTNESEEKVSFLREDLNETRTFRQNIKENLRQLQQLNNKNILEIEDSQLLKSHIKKVNTHLLTLAQQIYSCNQELYSNMNSHYSELEKNENLLYKNEELFKQKLERYKALEMTLMEQLEVKENKELEDIRRKELEDNALIEKNEALQREINQLTEKVYCMANNVNRELTLLEDEKGLEEGIIYVEESMRCKESKINELTLLLEEEKQLIETLEKELAISTTEFDKQICEANIENNAIKTTIHQYENNTDDISNNIKQVEEIEQVNEEKCLNFRNKLENIEVDERNLHDRHTKILSYCEQSLQENEEICKRQEVVNVQLKMDIFELQKKVDTEEKQIEETSKFLVENQPIKVDLCLEIEKGKSKVQELKATNQKLKEEYATLTAKREIDIKQNEVEIKDREQLNKKLQEDIDVIVSEINQLQDKLKVMENRQEDKITQLDDQINNLNIELERTKAEKLKNKEKTPEQKEQIRHWDSDSSMEGERVKFSEKIKQKIRMKKIKN